MLEKVIKIMIVDDSEFVINKLNDILNVSGFKVVGVAKNGLYALKLFKECHPDVVTLDINMPEMDGMATLRLLKQMKPNIKIVMCSSISTQPKVIEALKAGAKNFITKPFVGDKVLAVIKKVAEA